MAEPNGWGKVAPHVGADIHSHSTKRYTLSKTSPKIARYLWGIDSSQNSDITILEYIIQG